MNSQIIEKLVFGLQLLFGTVCLRWLPVIN